MAQLIKLIDYISRYELDIYRYPGQYIRLKQEKWDKLYRLWKNDFDHVINVDEEQPTRKSFLSKWNIFRKKDEEEKESAVESAKPLPKTEKDLRVEFLNHLFPFQLKWATSSLSYVSFMDQKYNNDDDLRYFLQRFPDNYLLMYYPIFNIKNAPIDGEIILISPIQIEVIYLLDDYSNANIIVSDDRTWTVEKENHQSKVLSPVHALRRTEQLIKSILKQKDLSFSIKKTVLTKKNTIIFKQKPYNTHVIGKREYKEWFNGMRELVSPLKSQQLKVAGQLLEYCLTSSVKRPEWEESTDDFRTVGEV